ncbi:MAG: DUF4276 family protein [Candidatus Sulfotelmatobacter sp.]
MVSHVEILVEEQSMEIALRQIVPRVLGDGLSFQVYPYLCKEDLMDKLPSRLRGYAAWLPPDWRVAVIVDRDDDQCDQLKMRLDEAAHNAGLTTRSTGQDTMFQVVNRIAIEELEAWFFGDWEAVVAAYPKANPNIPNKAGYRDPDAILGGTWEALERCLRRAGYFQTGLRKVEATRSIAHHMDPAKNRSTSFQVFRRALTEMTL